MLKSHNQDGPRFVAVWVHENRVTVMPLFSCVTSSCDPDAPLVHSRLSNRQESWPQARLTCNGQGVEHVSAGQLKPPTVGSVECNPHDGGPLTNLCELKRMPGMGYWSSGNGAMMQDSHLRDDIQLIFGRSGASLIGVQLIVRVSRQTVRVGGHPVPSHHLLLSLRHKDASFLALTGKGPGG